MRFRIKEAREAAGYSQKELAEILGVAPNTFHGYESGKHDPKSFLLTEIAEVCGVSTDFLLGLTDFPKSHTALRETQTPYSSQEQDMIEKYRILDIHGKRVVDSVLEAEYDRMTHVAGQESRGATTYIPCYDLAVSAGIGEPWSGDSGYKTRLEIPTEQVPDSAHYCARVNGDSMEPAYSDGDIVYVQRMDEMVRMGEIGIFFLNGDGYIKRLGRGVLESLNPQYEPIPIHEYDDLRCQGRVLGKV
ncbi:helix-turn-helix domain-containing protein [Acutalibacter sp. 1XD8-33]|uniref:XRE family transcriptional regulator n=1 Tax=Acutalibacter sp. 1XD8-33 TaxID=2320081 RepID=UPI000EA1C7DE|nr:LexA family transcriptional regulator [Acutalibacter sp. 1XD8-33]RKJ38497.1 helix-turn-helix domain-containing protein [Acutalibacter sp. 1XD8-33]